MTVTVGQGPITITVPTETGKSLTDAEVDLTHVGLAYAVNGIGASSAFIPAGDVVSITPAEGSQVAPNTVITITLSSGAPTAIPQ